MNLRLSALLMVAALAAIPADAAQRSYTVTDFSRIRLDGPYKVSVATGVAPFAKVSGAADDIDDLSIEVQGQTLVIRKSPSGWGGFPGDAPGPVEISVGTHDLYSIWLNGAGGLKVNSVKGQSLDVDLVGSGTIAIGQVALDSLHVRLVGAGAAVVAGTATEARAAASGTSSLDAHALTAKTATVSADGAAVVKMTVTDAAKVNTQGMTTVDLGGKPDCTVSASGSATVTGCRTRP
jgi:hypothetical protein